MKYETILLTGASGKLGSAIQNSSYFPTLLTPSQQDMDITKSETISSFFRNHDFDAIIHCAALARMKYCHERPDEVIRINTIGTSNLVIETIKKEKTAKKKIRFVQVSTDGVYIGQKGNYSEKDAVIPYNRYGWSKLGAETAVHQLSNYCIIRTSFFDPRNIPFEDSATDAFSSKIPIDSLVKAISLLLQRDFIGTINVGRERKSDYDHYKEFKPSLMKCTLKDIQKTVPFPMARDASMNVDQWKKIEEEYKNG